MPGDMRCDVAVVGGGITGLTTALMLVESGRSVCLVDQARITTGTSGHTTAKVTSLHHLIYAKLRARRGLDGARTYGAAMEAAKEKVAELAEGIDCDLRRRPAYVYATRPGERTLLEVETRAALAAGMPASLQDDPPLPFATTGAMRFDDQVEFHPVKYLLGLADRIVSAGGAIYENTRATAVTEEDDHCMVTTERGTIRAGHVVVGTLMPFLDRGLHFARAHASRSYVVTARVASGQPDGMLQAVAAPKHSLRSVPYDGTELLLALGESHHAGSSKATPERYAKVAEFVQRHWDVQSFEHRWSSQDYISDDSVPYIGPVNWRSKRVHIATGYTKWGLTGGTLAGMLINDAIAGRDNPWADTFSSTRIKPLGEGPRFMLENGRVGLRMVGDRVLHRAGRQLEDLAPGEGGLVSKDGQKVAGFRDREGVLHAVSATCTHLGCQVAWNAAEESWDCPCHASRFTVDGEILNGPATRPLRRL